jgi:hypothetical protein
MQKGWLYVAHRAPRSPRAGLRHLPPGGFVYAREGEILRCPWHEDERVDTYEVVVESGDLVLYV